MKLNVVLLSSLWIVSALAAKEKVLNVENSKGESKPKRDIGISIGSGYHGPNNKYLPPSSPIVAADCYGSSTLNVHGGHNFGSSGLAAGHSYAVPKAEIYISKTESMHGGYGGSYGSSGLHSSYAQSGDAGYKLGSSGLLGGRSHASVYLGSSAPKAETYITKTETLKGDHGGSYGLSGSYGLGGLYGGSGYKYSGLGSHQSSLSSSYSHGGLHSTSGSHGGYILGGSGHEGARSHASVHISHPKVDTYISKTDTVQGDHGASYGLSGSYGSNGLHGGSGYKYAGLGGHQASLSSSYSQGGHGGYTLGSSGLEGARSHASVHIASSGPKSEAYISKTEGAHGSYGGSYGLSGAGYKYAAPVALVSSKNDGHQGSVSSSYSQSGLHTTSGGHGGYTLGISGLEGARSHASVHIAHPKAEIYISKTEKVQGDHGGSYGLSGSYGLNELHGGSGFKYAGFGGHQSSLSSSYSHGGLHSALGGHGGYKLGGSGLEAARSHASVHIASSGPKAETYVSKTVATHSNNDGSYGSSALSDGAGYKYVGLGGHQSGSSSLYSQKGLYSTLGGHGGYNLGSSGLEGARSHASVHFGSLGPKAETYSSKTETLKSDYGGSYGLSGAGYKYTAPAVTSELGGHQSSLGGSYSQSGLHTTSGGHAGYNLGSANLKGGHSYASVNIGSSGLKGETVYGNHGGSYGLNGLHGGAGYGYGGHQSSSYSYNSAPINKIKAIVKPALSLSVGHIDNGLYNDGSFGYSKGLSGDSHYSNKNSGISYAAHHSDSAVSYNGVYLSSAGCEQEHELPTKSLVASYGDLNHKAVQGGYTSKTPSSYYAYSHVNSVPSSTYVAPKILLNSPSHGGETVQHAAAYGPSGYATGKFPVLHTNTIDLGNKGGNSYASHDYSSHAIVPSISKTPFKSSLFLGTSHLSSALPSSKVEYGQSAVGHSISSQLLSATKTDGYHYPSPSALHTAPIVAYANTDTAGTSVHEPDCATQ